MGDPNFADILDVARFPEADMVVGCYPCQGFSGGGRRKNDNNQNYLYHQFGSKNHILLFTARCL